MAEVLIDNKGSDDGVEDANNNTAEYTSEQETVVNRILELGKEPKDYYKILDVPEEASDDDLQKAFRNLALKIHPDKNRAPGSTEAFKKLGKAYEVLSKPENREDYDLYGPDLGRSDRRNRYHDYDDSDTDSDGDFAFDFFEFIFGRRGYDHGGWWRPPGYAQREPEGYSQNYSSRYQRQSYTSDARRSSEGHSQAYSAKYQKPSTTTYKSKDKKERERNVKSVFTTKGSREDDYDIDMVLKKLGETTVNPSKKKSQKK